MPPGERADPTHLVVATPHGFRLQRVPPTLHSLVPSAPSAIIEHGPSHQPDDIKGPASLVGASMLDT